VGAGCVLYRLHAALRLYLGFERPLLVIIATQAIAALIAVNCTI